MPLDTVMKLTARRNYRKNVNARSAKKRARCLRRRRRTRLHQQSKQAPARNRLFSEKLLNDLDGMSASARINAQRPSWPSSAR